MLRAAVAGALAVALGAGVAGCAQFDAALGQREAVVQFRSATPDSVRLKVRTACSGLPAVTTEPLPTDGKASDELYDVRYRIDKASDAEVARLQQCLARFPPVAGLELLDAGGN